MTTKTEAERDFDAGDLHEEFDDDPDCPHCHGDGRDPWNDYLLPCPLCQGEQTP